MRKSIDTLRAAYLAEASPVWVRRTGQPVSVWLRRYTAAMPILARQHAPLVFRPSCPVSPVFRQRGLVYTPGLQGVTEADGTDQSSIAYHYQGVRSDTDSCGRVPMGIRTGFDSPHFTKLLTLCLWHKKH